MPGGDRHHRRDHRFPRRLHQPHHIVAYTDGEIRQQYENTYIGRPIGGQPTINNEADGVRFVQPADLNSYDIHPSMRQQIGDYLAGTYPYLG